MAILKADEGSLLPQMTDDEVLEELERNRSRLNEDSTRTLDDSDIGTITPGQYRSKPSTYIESDPTEVLSASPAEPEKIARQERILSQARSLPQKSPAPMPSVEAVPQNLRTEDEELTQAQNTAGWGKLASMFGDAAAKIGTGYAGGKLGIKAPEYDKAAIEASGKMGETPLANLLQKREQGKKLTEREKLALEYKELKDSSTPGTEKSIRAYESAKRLAKEMGVEAPREGLSAKEYMTEIEHLEKIAKFKAEKENRKLTRDQALTAKEERDYAKDQDKLARLTLSAQKIIAPLQSAAISWKNVDDVIESFGPQFKGGVEALDPKNPSQNLPGVSVPILGTRLDWFSPEAKALQGSLQAIQNSQLKELSGGAVVANEIDRFLLSWGQGLFSSEADYVEALKRIREHVKEVMVSNEKNVDAIDPRIMQSVRQVKGVTSDIFNREGSSNAAPSTPKLSPEDKAKIKSSLKPGEGLSEDSKGNFWVVDSEGHAIRPLGESK